MPIGSRIAVLAALGCAMAASAPAQFQGVVTGFAIDTRSGSLRPILGVPGASRLGDPVALPAPIVAGAVRHNRAVVISNEQPQRVLVVRALTAASPQVISLDSAIAGVSRVFLSAGSTAALLYSSDAQTFQLIGGLDSTPRLSDPFPAAVVNGTFSTAAVADSAGDACALLASADASYGYVQKVCASAPGHSAAVAQLPGAQIVSLALLHQDQDAVLADQAGNQILLLPHAGFGWLPVVLAGAADGIASPTAVLPLDDSRIAVAQSGSSNLLVLNSVNQAAPQTFALADTPTRLDALDTVGVLASTAMGPGPLLLIDTRHDFGSFFVPMNQ